MSAIVPLATSHVSPVVVASTPGVSDPSDKNCAQRSYYLYDCRAVVPLRSSAAGRLGGCGGKERRRDTHLSAGGMNKSSLAHQQQPLLMRAHAMTDASTRGIGGGMGWGRGWVLSNIFYLVYRGFVPSVHCNTEAHISPRGWGGWMWGV